MKEMSKRVIMTIGGVSVSGFSVGLFDYSAFGMDPFQVLSHGIAEHFPFVGFGTLYMIINLIMLVAIFFIDKKKIGIGTFINIFLLGYVVEFSSKLAEKILPSGILWIRILMFLIAIMILCIGSSLYFTGDLGVSTYDAVALILAERTPVKFQYLRIATDFICTVIGVLLGALAGIGTIILALGMGPIITFFKHKLSMPIRYGRAKAKELVAEERYKKMGRQQIDN
jgi:uncharacterized membrane protein YczE